MTAKLPIIYEGVITAQGIAAITAGTFSTGTINLITNALTGNGKGTPLFKVFAVVTVAPTGDATARAYVAESPSGIPDQYDSGSLSVSIPSGETGTFCMGGLYSMSQYFSLKLGAETNDFTARLDVEKIMQQAQDT